MDRSAQDAGRATVLARVRRALGRTGADDDAPGARGAAERVERPQANTIPMRAQLQQPQLGELFDEMVQASGATLTHVAKLEDVPERVAAWCRAEGIGGPLVVAPQSPLAQLGWPASLPCEQRLPRSGDAVTLGTAAAGLAETGTLAVLSGPANPVTANFLPDAQVLVLPATAVLGTPEDLWAALRERGPLPRTVNWITGPSRTADIEMTMQMGAHGPIRLHVLIVDDDDVLDSQEPAGPR